MKKENKDILGCSEWADQIPTILELDLSDEVRGIWEQHTQDCSLCEDVQKEDILIRQGMISLPDPGPALVANEVMNRVRSKKAAAPLFRPLDLGWGLAASIVGIIFGFWLSTASEVQTQPVNQITMYEYMLGEMSEDIDPLMTEYFQTNGDPS